jgi:hypothetical protein
MWCVQDDPDQWANLTIVAAAATYLSYNVQILQRPEEYGANKLYHLGDVLYFVNSIFYTMAALRDDGWFWWMPLSGQLRGSSRILDKMVVESLQVGQSASRAVNGGQRQVVCGLSSVATSQMRRPRTRPSSRCTRAVLCFAGAA